jgi:hypothetical protein
MGRFSWVPPIMSLDIAPDLLIPLLERRYYFFVFLSLDYIKNRLAELSPEVTMLLDDSRLSFEYRHDGWRIIRSSRPIEDVQYGLTTLESALKSLAEPTPEIDLESFPRLGL